MQELDFLNFTDFFKQHAENTNIKRLELEEMLRESVYNECLGFSQLDKDDVLRDCENLITEARNRSKSKGKNNG